MPLPCILCLLKHGLSHFLHTLFLSKTFLYYPETPKSKGVLLLSQDMKISCFACFSPSTIEQNNDNNNDYPEGEINDGSFRLFTCNQLKLATRNFHSSEKVGEGGFGSVYKGKLVDGSSVAVKVLSVEVESMRGEREFVAELATLANIKHQNLVSLKGCCVEGVHRYLVYDYMENNSLYNTFLGSEERRMRFSWEIRRDISIGVARGLDFLHEEIKPHIVHRDIKAKNILLDSNFTPKVSDFGLAKLLRDETSYISTRVAGTLGYLAPEYANSGQVSRKSDVYSFGVLLLQIVSGLAVVDAYQDIESFIVEKAWAAYQANDLLKLVDPMLNMNFPEEEALKFLKVGLLCVQETAKLRPRMSEVVEKLTKDIDMEDVHISKPGFVADLRNIRIKTQNLNSSQESSSSGATFTSSIWSSANLARCGESHWACLVLDKKQSSISYSFNIQMFFS